MNSDLHKLLTRASAILALMAAVLLPIGYFHAGYDALEAEGQARADALVDELLRQGGGDARAALSNPGLPELIRSRTSYPHKESTLVYDRQGRIVAADPQPVPPPLLTSSTDIAGQGRLEIQHSLRQLVVETSCMALLGLALGATILFVLRTLPLRALERSSKNLQAEMAIRRRAEQELRDTLADLEQRVAERTASLTQAANEREKLNAELLAHRQHLDQLVAERTSQLQLILDTSPLGIVFSQEGRFIAVNRAIARQVGCSETELEGQPTLSLFADAAEHERYRLGTFRDVSRGMSHTGEYLFALRDGRKVWCELSSQAINPAHPEAGMITIVEDVTERRLAAAALHHRLDMEQLLSRIARDLARQPGDAMDGAIAHALQAVGEFVQAQSCFIFSLARDGQSQGSGEKFSHIWHAPEVQQPPEIAICRTPWLGAQLAELETIRLDSLDDLPAGAGEDRAWLEQQGIQALVRVPMAEQHGLVGVLGFDRLTALEGWLDEDIGLLQTLAEVFAAALARRDAVARLKYSHSLLQAALESTEDGLLVVDDELQIRTFNRRFLEIWGLPPDTPQNSNRTELFQIVSRLLKHPEQFHQRTQEIYQQPDLVSADIMDFVDGRVIERYSRPQTLGNRIVGRVWSYRDVSERVHREAELRRKDKQLAQAQAAGHVGNWELDCRTGQITCSDELRRVIRLQNLDEPDHPPLDVTTLLELTHPDDRPHAQRKLAELSQAPQSLDVTLRLRRLDGALRYVRLWGQSEWLQPGPGLRAVGIGQDITDQKQAENAIRSMNEELEERVTLRTAELEASFREMESFSYSISHDLRTPLRGINGFSHLLLEDYSDQLDAVGRDYLRRINAATERMGQLIDDLLHLARLSRAPLHLGEVDLSAMARGIIDNLKQRHGGQSAEFLVMEQLSCRGDATLLQAALAHLLENAWKFSCHQEPARIEFASLPGTPLVYYVRDNGVGFDMNHSSKLFQPFQRLQLTETFPGTGIGLATVRRILDRHGGRIWAISEPGKGASFYFTIGLPPENAV